jgi:hypothetical protein
MIVPRTTLPSTEVLSEKLSASKSAKFSLTSKFSSSFWFDNKSLRGMLFRGRKALFYLGWVQDFFCLNTLKLFSLSQIFYKQQTNFQLLLVKKSKTPFRKMSNNEP